MAEKPSGAICQHCKSRLWRLETISTTLLDFEVCKIRLGESAREEIRCARCQHKATLADAELIRQHDLYQAASGRFLDDLADEIVLNDAIQNVLAQANEAALAPAPRTPLQFKQGKSPRFRDAQDIADWFAWCSKNAMLAISGHYQARILRYEVISGDGETKVRYDHHEFDLLGPVCQQTRLFRAVNNDWWAFPAATWQPIPLEKRHWYSQRFRREMRQRWELIQRSAAPQSQIAEDR